MGYEASSLTRPELIIADMPHLFTTAPVANPNRPQRLPSLLLAIKIKCLRSRSPSFFPCGHRHMPEIVEHHRRYLLARGRGQHCVESFTPGSLPSGTCTAAVQAGMATVSFSRRRASLSAVILLTSWHVGSSDCSIETLATLQPAGMGVNRVMWEMGWILFKALGALGVDFELV